ncbi:MAG: sigma-54-dependent Fis family transcriptional regulator [Deltaproteobacteria bacterium]|nr:MAG: sigma-54-dependent Fis family transcriptional regulator [Deltaproteobacteria bacterium]
MQVLVVDDEPSIRRLIEKELGSDRRKITAVGTATEALQIFREETFDIVLLDMQLPDGNGMDLLVQFQELAPEVQVIIITGFGEVDNAVQAMKLGAYDYITKPYTLDRLSLVMEKAYQRTCLHRENRHLRRSQSTTISPKLVGQSKPIENIRYLLQKVAPAQVPVLLTGESGTGKNVVAQMIHALSERRDLPLITKNCGTFQKDLLRSELFGYRKGAFTGANDSYEGLLSFAHRGTMFLDEVGELSPDLQSSLLRVLENQTFRRLGEKEENKVDVRFLCATNRDLQAEVEAGRFSEAMYHRLNVFNIELPPLRNRKDDIPALIEYFLGRLRPGDRSARISDRAMQCLLAYDWPGNVRELQNVIERGLILSESGLITHRSLPLELANPSDDSTSDGGNPFLSLKEIERQHILAVMQYVDGRRTHAAQILGIGRKTLYRKLQVITANEYKK